MVHGREQLIPRDVLKQKLLNAGIDEAFMPAEIRIPDAFLRPQLLLKEKEKTGLKQGLLKTT